MNPVDLPDPSQAGLAASYDEQVYLASNPDIAEAVAQGRLQSGRQHYEASGYREARLASVAGFVREQARQIVTLHKKVAECERRVAESEQRMAELQHESEQRLEELETLRNSAPLRAVLAWKRALRSPALLARRAAKLAWWTVTLQLPQQLRDRNPHELLPEDDPMKGPRNGQDKPHFWKPKDDFCFAVPFEYALEVPQPPPSLAVVCHMFYVELLDEFKEYWSNIPFAFDLFITTDAEDKAAGIRQGLAGWDRGAVEVRIVPNRGRDIAPKLVACRDVYDRYEYFLHLHSKKSLHAGVLSYWRQYLLGTLLGSREIVLSVFEAFAADPKLGIVAPEHFDPVRGHIGWGWNIQRATNFARELGITIPVVDRVDFPSGSMFWGRSRALQPLLDRHLGVEDFSKEARQIDGTLAHVIERLYYFVCEQAGYRWIKMLRPELSKRTYNVLGVHDRDQLAASIVDTQFRLLLPLKDRSRPRALQSGRSESWRAVQANSDLQELPFAQFCEELRRHIAGQESAIDFDEAFYLEAHPDVAREVADGQISCGYVHYCLGGRREGRIYSDGAVARRFGVQPACPAGTPVIDAALIAEPAVLDDLPDSPTPTLLILLSHLQEDFFFAGYAEFFRDYVPVMERFERVILAVRSAHYEPALAQRYLERIEVIPFSAVGDLRHKPDVFVAFNAHLTELAHRLMPSHPERIVYYCQDFEGGFFPYSVDYVIGERAVANSRNLVVSTGLLRRFLADRRLITHQNVHVTRPRIEVLDVPSGRSRRIFFYYRPESFHRRNLPELVKEAAVALCQRHPGFEIFLVGSVAASYSYKVNGTQVYVLSKLPKQDYVDLISSCDVVVSMIYAAHPGVIAFQAAASGIPTVTNVFDNRDAALLRRISSNIVPYDPVRQDLVECIEQALQMPKGERSFDEGLYSGDAGGSLVAFHEGIRETVRAAQEEQLAA